VRTNDKSAGTKGAGAGADNTVDAAAGSGADSVGGISGTDFARQTRLLWERDAAVTGKPLHTSNTVYCMAPTCVSGCCSLATNKNMNLTMPKWRDNILVVRPGDLTIGAVPAHLPRSESDVTLVTQGSTERIDAFVSIMSAWAGPIVVLFAITADSVPLSAASSERRSTSTTTLAGLRSASIAWRPNIRVLAVLGYATDAVDRDEANNNSRSMATSYPVNAFRNMVVDQATTTNWVFPIDIDFVPSHTLYDQLVKFYLPRMAKVPRAALVVPHFEYADCIGDGAPHPFATMQLPAKNITDLSKMILNGTVRPFAMDSFSLLELGRDEEKLKQTLLKAGCRYSTTTQWPKGIRLTNYLQWWTESTQPGKQGGAFRVNPSWNDVDQHSAGWEPFVIVRKKEAADSSIDLKQFDQRPSVQLDSKVLPRYNEAYVGRSKNKVEWIGHLRAQRYQFFTVLQEFLGHLDHARAVITRTRYRSMRVLHKKVVANRSTAYASYPSPTKSIYYHGIDADGCPR
jgi:hypothetical protein